MHARPSIALIRHTASPLIKRNNHNTTYIICSFHKSPICLSCSLFYVYVKYIISQYLQKAYESIVAMRI